MPFKGECEKILLSRAGHKWQRRACAFRVEYLRLQKHIQNI